MADFSPSIGKNVIETLTVGMYDVPFFIYREYVQNSADAIDSAVRQKIFKDRSEGRIDITINPEKRQIIIEDNATGIEAKKVPSLLGNVAQSTKDKYTDKGSRGIGRLGALGYCDTLTYETSFKGEKDKSVMIWDAKNLREILGNPKLKIDASQVISAITKYSRLDDDRNSHYFKIIMEGVTNDDLLDLKKVNDYLAMVVPVPFNKEFSFAKEIYEHAKTDGIAIDEYKVYINEIQLFKGYKDEIYQESTKGKKKTITVVDKLYSIKFFKEFYGNEMLYWGWYRCNKKHEIYSRF